MAGKLKQFLADLWTVLTAAGVFIAALALVLISIGYGKQPSPAADAANVLRILTGILGGLLLTGAVWLTMTLKNVSSRIDSVTSTLNVVRTQMAHAGDDILRGGDELMPWGNALRNRSLVKIVGMSLRSHSRDHLQTLRDVLKSGGRCVCILLKPRSTASELAAMTYNQPMTPTEYDHEITLSTNRLLSIAKEFPQQFSVKQLERIPIAGMTYLEGGGLSPRMIVELYTTAEGHRPYLDLSPDRDEEWFEHFLDELNGLEREATVAEPRA